MSFTDPSASDTLTQRRSNGWGQAMAFPGPPEQTIEDSGDRARESEINVEGANIRVGGMSNAFNMSYNPSLNSPVFNYQNNPSNTYFGLQISYMQMQMQEVYQIIGTQLDADIDSDFEARIAALETWRATGLDSDPIVMRDWSFDGTTIKNDYSRFTFVDGLITVVNNIAVTGDTPTTACP
jgi:hypothetical protein